MMNRGEQAKRLAKQWAAKMGPTHTRLKMVNFVNKNGKKPIGFSTADKLSRGVYDPTPGHDITEALFELTAMDGFTLASEAS